MNHPQQPEERLVAHGAKNGSSSSSSAIAADLSMFSSPEMIMMNNGLGRPSSHSHLATSAAAVVDGQMATIPSAAAAATTTKALLARKTSSSAVVPSKSHPSSKNASTSTNKRRKKKSEFRKAPQAPRRFKSPYILFSISKMAEYKNQRQQQQQQQPPIGSSSIDNAEATPSNSNNTNVNVTSISRRIADEWKTLSPSERSKWDEVAKQDKLRYDAEKKLYTGPWQVPSKRRRKDPSAPKRPASAFLFFCQNQRRKLKEANPELKNTDISKLLGEAWKNAPQHIKQPHIDREQTERELYKTKIAEWRTQKNHEIESERQHRIAVANQYVIHQKNGNGGGGGSSGAGAMNVANLPEISSPEPTGLTLHVPQPCTSTSTTTTTTIDNAANAPPLPPPVSTTTTLEPSTSTRATPRATTSATAKERATPAHILPAPLPTDLKKPPPPVNHQHNSSPWELGGILAGLSSTTSSTTTHSVAAAAPSTVAFQPNPIISGITATSRTSSSIEAATEAAPSIRTSANVPFAPSKTTDMKKVPTKLPSANNSHQILPQWDLGGILAGIPSMASNAAATTTPQLTVPPIPPTMQQYYGFLPSILTSAIPINNMNAATNNVQGQTAQLSHPPLQQRHVSATTSFLPQYHLKLPPPLPPPSLLPLPQQQDKLLPTTFPVLPQAALQKATNDPVPAAASRTAATAPAPAGMYEHPPDGVATRTTTTTRVVASTETVGNNVSDPQSAASVPVQQPQQAAPLLSTNVSTSVAKPDNDTIGVSNEGAADPYIALSVASQTTAATSNPVEELETLLQSQPYSALEMRATPSYAALITNSCANNTNTTITTTAGGMVAEEEDNDDDELQHDPDLQDIQDDASPSMNTASTNTKQPSQRLANKPSSFAPILPKPLDYGYSDEPSSGHHWFGLFNETAGSSFDMPLLEEAAQELERNPSANVGGGNSPNNTTG